MITKLDLGYFLKLLVPSKRKDYGREKFLDKIFNSIIEDYQIKDKEKKQYFFGKEITSRLFNNKADMPKSITKVLNILENRNIDKYVDEIYGIITKYNRNIELVTADLVSIINIDPSFNKNTKDELLNLISEQKNGLFYWKVLVNLCNKPNRRENTPTRKQGRPPFKKTSESFFYLSEEEKKSESVAFLQYVISKKAKLTFDDLNYFFEILSYSRTSISYAKKEKIIYAFLKKLPFGGYTNKATQLKMEFIEAKQSFKDDYNNYNGWDTIIEKQAILEKINTLNELYNEALNKPDFSEIKNELVKISSYDTFYIKSDDFNKKFLENNCFLPDFTGHINQNIWSYCITIAQYLGKAHKKNEFNVILNNLIILKNNDTVKNRCESLLEQCNNYEINTIY